MYAYFRATLGGAHSADLSRYFHFYSHKLLSYKGLTKDRYYNQYEVNDPIVWDLYLVIRSRCVAILGTLAIIFFSRNLKKEIISVKQLFTVSIIMEIPNYFCFQTFPKYHFFYWWEWVEESLINSLVPPPPPVFKTNKFNHRASQCQ